VDSHLLVAVTPAFGLDGLAADGGEHRFDGAECVGVAAVVGDVELLYPIELRGRS